jgi:flavin-binding protein dodecin
VPRQPSKARPASPRTAESGAVWAIEASGSSRESWDDAVRDALREARQEGDPVAFQVVHLAGDVAAGRIRTYRARLKVGVRARIIGP